MSYEIKITAASLGELGDKLLAMGQQLTVAHNPVMPEAAASATATATRTRRKAAEPAAAAEPEPVAGEVVQEEAQAGDGVALQSVAHPEGEAVAEDTDINDAALETAEIGVSIDYDKDVVPLVLEVVSKKTKPVVQAILSEFGVERASQLDPSLWGELIAVLQAELA